MRNTKVARSWIYQIGHSWCVVVLYSIFLPSSVVGCSGPVLWVALANRRVSTNNSGLGLTSGTAGGLVNNKILHEAKRNFGMYLLLGPQKNIPNRMVATPFPSCIPDTPFTWLPEEWWVIIDNLNSRFDIIPSFQMECSFLEEEVVSILFKKRGCSENL